jgi:hypothetical protein
MCRIKYQRQKQRKLAAEVGAEDSNNNQAFYSQASWDRLKMKPHEPKKTDTK